MTVLSSVVSRHLGVMNSIFVMALFCAGGVISKHTHRNNICSSVELSELHGVISSPNYPRIYPNYTSCTWIISAPPKATVSISVLDFDIEEDMVCRHPPCCTHTWLSLPKDGGGGIRQFCGTHRPPLSVSVSQVKTNIKFHTSNVVKGGRGFQLNYTITIAPPCPGVDEIPCGEGDHQCFNNMTQKCNGVVDCISGLDEMNCDSRCAPGAYDCHSELCMEGRIRCSSSFDCFVPNNERCDGKFDCPFGDDEVGCEENCEGKIACTNGDGCYLPLQRCNLVRDCSDGSDEDNCPQEVCMLMPDRFQCDNGKCISESLWCNNQDDCGDNSDEHCTKVSIVTAAIMGSLICGLLLTIAFGCMRRLYNLRVAVSSTYRIHHDEIGQIPGGFRSALHPNDDFFHREPPPAYTVAVAECQQLQRVAPSNTSSERHPRHHHSSRRSSRRYSSGRRRMQRITPSVSDAGSAHSRNRALGPELPSTLLPGANISTTLETSLAAQQRESVIFSSQSATENKSENANIPSSSLEVISRESREVREMEVNDTCLVNLQPDECPESSTCTSSSTSASDSPSRESVTSSTSLLSYLSGNDDMQLLVVPPQ